MKQQLKTLVKNHKKDKMTHLFFNSLIFFVVLLLVIGAAGAYGILNREADEVIFKTLGMCISVTWACIFVGYFIWAIYFYNINYGYTDKDWEDLQDARERLSLGEPVDEKELEEPSENPYKDQTFGLPGGTVRGMIAFTLLFGGIAITVVSMGMDNELVANTFFWDHYEFFKTAFLMMIAFYFGSRSLEYLKDRWPSTAQKQRMAGEESSTKANLISSSNETNAGNLPSQLKAILAPAEQEQNKDLVVKTRREQLKQEFVQINDNEEEKNLNLEQIESVANEFKIEMPALRAVIQVESAGSGFLEDGRPKILFEGHKFWSHLKEKGIDPEQYLPDNQDILYPKWTRNFYLGKEGEYSRLNKALLIDKEAAYYSASWGLFQILGENVKTKWVRRHKDINAFVEAQYASEHEHLLDFVDFIQFKKAKGKTLLEHLKAKDWASFAYGYNGAGYAQNNYDVKLQRAYERFSAVG